MNSDDYEMVRQIVYERSRINLGSNKLELVAARLAKRIRVLGMKTVDDYCQLLRSDQGEEEIDNLVDVISTNHTQFFRESAHFEYLVQKCLPELVAAREKAGDRHLRVWSAACSSGEEPYTLAIVLDQFFQDRPGWHWEIVATDISSIVLQKALRRTYSAEAVRHVPPALLSRYFESVPHQGQKFYRVREELAGRVQFRRLNLLGPTYSARRPFDVVFCRNVMIYFDRPTQQELVRRLSTLIPAGGYLFLGHSESLTAVQHQLKAVSPAVYLR